MTMIKKLLTTAIILSLTLSTFLFLNSSNIATAATLPWDFEDHGFSHVELTSLNNDQLLKEITQMNMLFNAYGLPAPLHYAYPMGVIAEGPGIGLLSQYRITCRTAGDGVSIPEKYPVSNWHLLSSVCLLANSTYGDIKSWIDKTIDSKGLLCLCTNKVSTPAIEVGCTPALLSQILDYLVEKQNAGSLSVLTMRQAYTAFNGQKAIVVMSFDDGWVTDYNTVWPMFKARGLTGTSYIHGIGLDSDNPDSLTWAMVTEMAQTSPTQPEPKSWTVKVDVKPAEGGSTTSYGLVNVPFGSLTVTAFPATNFVFSYWLFDGTKASTSSSTISLPEQTAKSTHTLTAYFAPAPPTTPFPTITPAPPFVTPSIPTFSTNTPNVQSPAPSTSGSPSPTQTSASQTSSPTQTNTPAPTGSTSASPNEPPTTILPNETLSPTAPEVTPSGKSSSTPSMTIYYIIIALVLVLVLLSAVAIAYKRKRK